jgi:EAL domain-containing protein (putative c-di-GMP-specific phosphodiesterase class I)
MAEPETLYQQALSRGQAPALDLAAFATLLPQGARLTPRLPLHLRVHASTLQLRAEAIHELLRQAGAGLTDSYEHLTLEIVTRGCALGPLELGSTLISLQRMGATLAWNDPWQAPAALLESFPTQLWRFGGSLIHGLAQDSRRRALLEALLGLARRKQTPILAAGVRRPEDLRILFDLGVDRIQGDLLCPALSAPDLQARLGDDNSAAD